MKLQESKTYTMKEQLLQGKVGEEIIYWWLKARPSITDIEDVRDSTEYRIQDIDFIVESNNKTYTLEVKTDYYTTGNIFVELESTMGKTQGCALKTKSDFILYYFINENKLFIIDTKEFQLYIDFHRYDFVEKVVHNRGYDSLGILIPYKILKDDLLPSCFREAKVFSTKVNI